MKSFSSGDVAKICDVNPRTVIRWIEAKKLQAFKLPGRGNNRVAHADLITFLTENKIPIPHDLILEQESACYIISKDKQLIRHGQRIARNAGYITTVMQYGIEAGIQIAFNKPSVIIIDIQTSNCDVNTLLNLIDDRLDYKPYIIVFDDVADTKLSAARDARVFKLVKPVDNYALAMVLDSIVEAEQEIVA